MDIQQYIASGILEAYCAGILDDEEQENLLKTTALYPEIRAELAIVELTFERLANSFAVTPAHHVKEKLLAMIGGITDSPALDIHNLPVINASHDPQPWLDLFAHLIPEEPTEAFNLNVIRQDEIVQQMLITGNTDIPDEAHSEFYESLFILKGRCKCRIGNKTYTLGPGDFVEIPLNTTHDIRLLTPFVTTVLQYRFV